MAEANYRERCAREFDWRVQRKAQLEEAARERQQQLERDQNEERLRLEQARIDRLPDEAASLRRAADIRCYVEEVRRMTFSDSTAASVEEVEQWARWALAEADRIDPVKTGRFCGSHWTTAPVEYGPRCGTHRSIEELK